MNRRVRVSAITPSGWGNTKSVRSSGCQGAGALRHHRPSEPSARAVPAVSASNRRAVDNPLTGGDNDQMLELEPIDQDLPYAVADDTLQVGRAAFNGLVLENEAISACHAVLAFREGRWQVNDLGSANGTVHGEVPVQAWRAFGPGDTIHFGPLRYHVLRADRPGSMDHDEPGLRATATEDTPEIAMTLRPLPMGGSVAVDHSSKHTSATFTAPFDLLHALARARLGGTGGWVDTETLRRQVWGVAVAAQNSDNAFDKLVYDTRAALASIDAPRTLIARRRGWTRLEVPPDRLRILQA